MARLNPEVHLRPSILDRLLDDEPEVPREPLHACRQSLLQAQRAVMHDLEALLNTRQEVLEEFPEEFAEVHRSLVMYGLPDFTALRAWAGLSNQQWSLTTPQESAKGIVGAGEHRRPERSGEVNRKGLL